MKISGISTDTDTGAWNTDGIMLSQVTNAEIANSILKGGDDNISLKSYSYNVHIHDVTCIGGHGIR